jgi:hypothetical protein
LERGDRVGYGPKKGPRRCRSSCSSIVLVAVVVVVVVVRLIIVPLKGRKSSNIWEQFKKIKILFRKKLRAD